MENKKIKLAIFDIDDTLIKRGKTTIEESALKALHTLEENGIEVLVATGRAYIFVHDDIKTRLNPDYAITNTGACIYHKGILQSKIQMKREDVNAMITYARTHNLSIGLKQEHHMPIYNGLHQFKTTYMQGSAKQDILTDATQAPLIKEGEELPMGLFIFGDETVIEASKPLLPHSDYAKAYEQAYDIFSKEAGKIIGIETILKEKNLTWDNVIAVGDAANDMEMIQKAAIGVAMGNATPSLKDAADYISTDILDNGVYNALKHFNLI
jgi:Cof subfamily protein (haloacid dehalogenase superfamily)